MASISAVTRSMWWAVGDPVIETGVTHTGETTLTGLTMFSAEDEQTYLSAVVTHVTTYNPLPDTGWLEAGNIYGYDGGLVIVRQSHNRTAHAPEDIPALLSVYRADGGTLEWVANERVEVGTRRTYGGATYQAIQAHTTQTDWTPLASPALWMELITQPGGGAWTAGVTYALDVQVTYSGQTYRCLQAHTAAPQWLPTLTLGVLWALVVSSQEWAVGVAYKVNDEVTYTGHRYKCLQAHTSQAGWTPSAVPALWQDLGAI